MSRRVGTATRVGAFAALALLLTGCIKLNMNLGINDDDTVSGTIQLGVDKQLLELSGQNAEELLGGDSPFPSNAPGVTVKPFDDGEFAGQEFTFESVPLEEFNSGGFAGATGLSGVTGSSDALNIQRQGDTFVVTGGLDLSSGLSGATGPFGGSGGAELFRSAAVKIAFTFPGEVIMAPGGQIDGNTVTYVPTFGELLEINATGSAIDNGQAQDVTGGDDGSNLLLYILIGAAVVALFVVVLSLVLRGRNKGKAGGPESGFGEAAVTAPQAPAPRASPSATPPVATAPGPSATPPPPPPPAPPPTGG